MEEQPPKSLPDEARQTPRAKRRVLIWVFLFVLLIPLGPFLLFPTFITFGLWSHYTSLSHTAEKLHAGMNRSDVDSIMRNFIQTGTDKEFHERLGDMAHDGLWGRPQHSGIFNTNVDRGTEVGYWPSGAFSAFELCDVYFDTNSIIVGWEYYHFR